MPTSPEMAENRQVVRRRQAEERLLQAAAELIAEVGPRGLTLADIGERAGYSRGLATHHFGSKGALLERLVDEVTTKFQDAFLGPGEDESALDALQRFVTVYFAMLEDFRPINRARIVLWADAVAHVAAETRPAVISMDDEFRNGIGELVQHGIASGELTVPVDPRAFASVVLAMLRGIALQQQLGHALDLRACRLEVRWFVAGRLMQHPSVDDLKRWEGAQVC